MADYLSKIFGASPVKPMQEHMERAVESVAQLVLFIEAASTGDWETAEKLQQGIGRLENDADDRKRSLRLNLPSTLLLPVDRHDLLELLTTQDKIANRAKDIAGLMLGRKMQIPDRLAIGMLTFVNRCHDATLQAQRVVMELDELFETGFRGAEARLVRAMIEELDRIEGDTDDLQRQIRKVLFELENELPPVEVMFLYKVIEWIGDLADQAQRVGSRLHLVLAR